jgi:cytochrome bd-type quinol oxidase subunit 2
MIIALAILFGLTIFMNGSSFAAIHGRFAQQLELPGSAVIPCIPWVALGAYIVAVTLIKRIKKTSTRWLAFIAATLIGNAITIYPILLLHHGSTLIVANGEISRESLASFKARYPVLLSSYMYSNNGGSLRVRNDQFSPDMQEYLAQLTNKKPNKP